MFTLYLKEIKSFFSSIIGYVIIATFLIITGLFIWVFPNYYNVFELKTADLQGLFNLSCYLFLFLIPAITMRSFSEEKKTGTMELLFTKPLSDNQIIGAKFLACSTCSCGRRVPVGRSGPLARAAGARCARGSTARKSM